VTLVSVIVPMFNRRALIEATLRSALVQEWPQLEVIVVDDGSTDGSADVVERTFGKRVRLLRLGTNRGRSAARNAGCEIARGDLIAFLDSDDLWDPTKTARQVACFDDPRVSLAHCYVRQIDAAGVVCHAESAEILRAFHTAEARGYDYAGLTRTWCRLYTPAVIVRREALQRSGGFDPTLAMFEDWDLFWRIAQTGRVATLPEVLASVRVHEGNAAPTWAARSEPWLRVMHKHLATVSQVKDREQRRRATANLLMNVALGHFWQRDSTEMRRWLAKSLRVDVTPLLRPFDPVWAALLLHSALPASVADAMARFLGVDRYVDSATMPR
jgi:glycosyltransferase involved in cell wall biosynthesis